MINILIDRERIKKEMFPNDEFELLEWFLKDNLIYKRRIRLAKKNTVKVVKKSFYPVRHWICFYDSRAYYNCNLGHKWTSDKIEEGLKTLHSVGVVTMNEKIDMGKNRPPQRFVSLNPLKVSEIILEYGKFKRVSD